MTLLIRALATALLGLMLVGCSEQELANSGRLAGSELDDGAFGVATRQNIGAMRGEKWALLNLSRRFSAEVPDTVTFAFNRADLDAQARAILRRQAEWMLRFPELRFRVVGHADKVGPESYNYGLGLRRARAVARYLISLGVPRARLEAVASKGEREPVVDSEGPERLNRRAVTYVRGFASPYRGTLDGKYARLVYRNYVNSAGKPSEVGAGSDTGQ